MADDVLASVRERGRANRFWQHLGIEVEGAGEGWVKLRVPVHDDLRNAAGAPVLCDARMVATIRRRTCPASTRPNDD